MLTLICYFWINQVRKWEKSLQQVFGETNVDKLKSEAKEELNKYFASLPKPSKLETVFITLVLLNIFIYYTPPYSNLPYSWDLQDSGSCVHIRIN